MDIETFTRKIRKKIRNKNNYEWEIVISQGRSANLSWSEGKLEERQFANDGGFGVRLIAGGRQGFSSTNRLDPAEFASVWNEAESMIPFVPEDAFRRLPEPSSIEDEDLETFDPEISTMNMEGIEALLEAMEKKVLSLDSRIKKAYRVEWEQGAGRMILFNSKDVYLSKEGTSCSAGVTCIAEEDGDTQVGSFSQSRRFIKDIQLDELPRRAGELALDQLSGRTITSGRLPVLCEPWVMMEFLSMIASAVCADNIQKGKSLYRGKLGKNVASSLVNIVDDARLKRALGSSMFDDEGISTRTTPVIKDGVLQSFLYDSYTAGKDKTQSTGSAQRPSYRGMPEPGTSNFILHPGKASREQVIKETERGLRLISLMGMHTADPVSGEFSVGAIGTLIEKGKFTHAVRGVTIAGNVIDLMKDIEAVCDDYMFFGSSGCPMVKIKNVMVGGS